MPILPIAGKQYTVVEGDSLSNISARVYGDYSLWPRIYSANQTTLKSSDPNLIYPGEVLNIPVLPDIEALKGQNIVGKNKDDLTIVVDGYDIKYESARALITLDTIGDACNAVVTWRPGANKEIDKRLKPYSYAPVTVWIGSKKIITGYLYNTEPEMTDNGLIKNLEIFSKTIDLVDSTIKPPYERNNVRLDQIAKEYIEPLGMQALFDFKDDYVFDRVTASATDTYASHLLKLCHQRSVLMTSTPNGDVLFTKANPGAPIGTLSEGTPMPTEWKTKYEGRNRFNAIKVNSKTPLGENVTYTSKDNAVPRTRFKTINANESQGGNIRKVAEWERSKQLAKALTMPFPVTGWYAPNGEIFNVNKAITIISPTLDIPKGATLLINKVEFISSTSERNAVLSLVPKEVYTGEPLADIWNVE